MIYKGKYTENIERRVMEIATYFANNKTTVRKTAEHFNVSKTTVHIDLTERLARIDPILYVVVSLQLAHNKAFRHIRGGLATKAKYKELKEN